MQLRSSLEACKVVVRLPKAEKLTLRESLRAQACILTAETVMGMAERRLGSSISYFLSMRMIKAWMWTET